MTQTSTGDVTAESTGSGTAATSGAGSTGPGEAKTVSDEIRDLRKRAQTAEAEAKRLADADAARLQAEAVKRGEFETVLAAVTQERDTFRAEAEESRAAKAARREAILATLPEAHRPIASDLPLDKLEAYAGLHVTQPTPPPSPAGIPGSAVGSKHLTPEEIKKGVREGGLAWFRQNAGVM